MAKETHHLQPFSVIKLCFVINVLNNNTIILHNLAQSPPVLPTTSSAKYQTIFRAISQDYCLINIRNFV